METQSLPFIFDRAANVMEYVPTITVVVMPSFISSIGSPSNDRCFLLRLRLRVFLFRLVICI